MQAQHKSDERRFQFSLLQVAVCLVFLAIAFIAWKWIWLPAPGPISIHKGVLVFVVAMCSTGAAVGVMFRRVWGGAVAGLLLAGLYLLLTWLVFRTGLHGF